MSSATYPAANAGPSAPGDRRAPALGEGRVVSTESGDLRGDLDEQGRRAREGREGRRGRLVGPLDHAGGAVGVEVVLGGGLGRVDGPLGDQAIGGDAPVEVVGAGAVHILDVARGGGTEAAEVEVGVAGLERVEGPGDDRDADRAGVVALDLLHPAAEPLPLVARDEAGQLRVEAPAAAGPAEEREREPDGLAVRQERAQGQAAVVLRTDHRGDGHDVAVVREPPRPALGVLEGDEVGGRLGRSDRDRGVGHRSARSKAFGDRVPGVEAEPSPRRSIGYCRRGLAPLDPGHPGATSGVFDRRRLLRVRAGGRRAALRDRGGQRR